MKTLIVFLASLALGLAWALPCPAAEGTPPCPPEPFLDQATSQTLQRAQQMHERGQETQAVEMLNEQMARDGQPHPHVPYVLGVLHYHRGNKQAARDAFAEAIRIWPCFDPALRNLATLQYELGQPLAAAETAARAYGLKDPPEAEWAYLTAMFFQAGRRTEAALTWLLRATAIPQPKREWLVALAQARMELKQWEPAREVVQRLLNLGPEDPQLWRLLASLEVHQQRYAPAAAALGLAVRLTGAQPGDWRNLAELHRAAGAPAQAALYYRKAFAPEPTPEQWLALAHAYWQANDLEPAAQAAHRAWEGKPAPDVLAFMAEIRLRQRQYQAAADLYLAAAEQTQGDQAARWAMNAGYCGLRLRQLERAAKAFTLAGRKANSGGESARLAEKLLGQVREQLAAAQR